MSVSDKTNLLEFARGLAAFPIELVSTGGTHRTLTAGGLTVREVSEMTGFPEMLDGRRQDAASARPRRHPPHPRQPGASRTVGEHGIEPIDLVVVNLYPFEATVAKSDSSHEEIIENIDIGGPAMMRSAAKNYHDVAVVTDPEQYGAVLDELRATTAPDPDHAAAPGRLGLRAHRGLRPRGQRLFRRTGRGKQCFRRGWT